jgi:hypothetical protein
MLPVCGRGDGQQPRRRVPDRRCAPGRPGPAAGHSLPGRPRASGQLAARPESQGDGIGAQTVQTATSPSSRARRRGGGNRDRPQATLRSFPGPFTARPGQSLEDQIAQLGHLVNRLRDDVEAERNERRRAISEERQARLRELRAETQQRQAAADALGQEFQELQEVTTGGVRLRWEGVPFLLVGVGFTTWPDGIAAHWPRAGCLGACSWSWRRSTSRQACRGRSMRYRASPNEVTSRSIVDPLRRKDFATVCLSLHSTSLCSGSLLIRVGCRGAADGQRPPHQAALGVAAAGALATTTANSAATPSMGSTRPAPLVTPPARTGARPVLPR